MCIIILFNNFWPVDYGGACTKYTFPERNLLEDKNWSTSNILEDFDALNNLEDNAVDLLVGKLSRNTGLITFTHQGTDVPDIVSKLSFLHEIGHSLGSPVCSTLSP
jgi:hypothetical protein